MLIDPGSAYGMNSPELPAALQEDQAIQRAIQSLYKEAALLYPLSHFPKSFSLNRRATGKVYQVEGALKQVGLDQSRWVQQLSLAAISVAGIWVAVQNRWLDVTALLDHFKSWGVHDGIVGLAMSTFVTKRAAEHTDYPSGVGVQYEGATATILLKHGPVNAMTLEMIRDLKKIVDRIQATSGIKAVIIKGVPEVTDKKGNSIFGVGADIGVLKDSIKAGRPKDADQFYHEEYQLYDRIAELHKTKPVVSLITGTAVGSQLGLAMTGLLVTTKDATLGMPETKIGFFPDVGATHLLPQRVGLPAAKYLGFTSRFLNGTEAFRYGLADAYTSEYTLKDLEEAIKDLAESRDSVTPDQMHQEISRFNVRATASIIPKSVLQKLFGAQSFESIVASLRAAIQYDQEQGKESTEGRVARETLAALSERSPIGLHVTNELMNLNSGRTLALTFRKELVAARALSRHPDYVTGVDAFKSKKAGRPAFQGHFDQVDYAQLSQILGESVTFVDEAKRAAERKEGPYLIQDKGDWERIEADFRADENAFWLRRAYQELEWFKKPTVGITENIDEDGHFEFTYFEDGELNASYELLDRQVKRGYGDNIAYTWIGDPADSTTGEPTEPIQTVTYKQLLEKVELFANALTEMGVGTGDGITLYTASNTIEAKVARLAAMRIGAIFTPVFPGLAAQELSDRAAQINTKVVLTVNGGYRQGELEKWKEEVVDRAFEDFVEKKDIDGFIRKALTSVTIDETKAEAARKATSEAFANAITVNYAEIVRVVDEALMRNAVEESARAEVARTLRDQTLTMPSRIQKMVVIERVNRNDTSVNMKAGRDVYFNDELARMKAAGKTKFDPVRVKSEHPLFVIFTSGTTGKPKGAYHTTGGYLVNVSYSMKFAWNVQPGERYWISADDGWITGNSAMSDGPLLNAGHSFLYEGLPNWPTDDRLWKMLSENKINYYKTGVTAIRNASKANPALISKWDLSNLKGSASCAEPLYSDVQAFWDSVLLRDSKTGAKVINVFWRTEDGIMSAFIPHVHGRRQKPDASTVASPWGKVKVLVLTKDDDGKIVGWREAEAGEPGSVFVRHHPSMIRGLWNDRDRFRDTYWPTQVEIDGQRWHKAGDAGVMSEDGYITFLGRDDEVINTSGHRIGTQEIEGLVIKVPEVKLAAVVGIPHLIKGETPVAFVIVKPGVEITPDLDTKVRKMVEEGKGKIARPEEVFYVTDFPNTKSNKVLRRLLQQIAAMQSSELAEIYRAIQDPETAEKLRAKDPETLARILGVKVAKSVDTLPVGAGGTEGLLAAIRGVAEKREIGKVGRRELPIGDPNEIDFVTYLPREVHDFVAAKFDEFGLREVSRLKRKYEMVRRWYSRMPKDLSDAQRKDYLSARFKAEGLSERQGQLALRIYSDVKSIREKAIQRLIDKGLIWPLGKPFVPGMKLPPYMFAWAYVKDQWGRPVYGHPEDVLYEIIAPTPRKPGPNEVVGYTLIAGITRNMVAAGEDLNIGGFNFHDMDYHISGSDGVFLTAEIGSETEKAGTTRLGDIFYDYSGEAGLLDPRMGFDPMATEDFKIKGYQTGDGTLAQFAVFQAPQVIIKPADMTLEQAASHNLDQGTVLKSLMDRAGTQLDETAFIEGAAGGTGHLAVNIADMLGARATGLVSSDERGQFAMQQGAKAYINRKEPRFAALWQPVPDPQKQPDQYAAWAAAADAYREEYQRLNNGRLANVINASVGRPTFASNVELLAEGGRLTYYGADQGFHLSFRGKSGSRSARDAFEKNKLEPGHGVLVYYRSEEGRQGIDSVGIDAIKEALRYRARVLVIASTVEEQIYLQRRFGQSIGVESIENLKTGYPQFEWPDEMPDLDFRDASGKATVDIDRRFHYQQHTLKIFGDVVKKFFKTDDNPAGSPEVVIERAGQNTLGISAWLVRKMTGRVIYLEDTKDQRLSFYAPDVWFSMKTIDFPTFSILGTHLFHSFQAQKIKRLFEQGRLHIEPPNMFDWSEATRAIGSLADAKVQGNNAVRVAAPAVEGLKTYEGKDQLASEWHQTVKGFGRTVKVTLYEIMPGRKAAILSLESPGNFNVLNTTMVKNLKAAIDFVEKETGIKAMVVTGSGKLFCGGADLKEMQVDLIDANDGTELAREAQGVFDRIEKLSFPVVAALNGSALGGGMELAMSAHYRIASAKAEIGQPEITYRIIPGFGGTQRLPRLMEAKSGIQGVIDAAKIILNGRRFSALDAQRGGLVDEVASTDALSRALELSYQFIQTGKGPLAAAQASRHQTIQDWNLPKPLAPNVIESDHEVQKILMQSERVGRDEAARRALQAIYRGYADGIDAGLIDEAGSFGYLIAHPRQGRTGLQQFAEKIIDALPLRGIERSAGRHEDMDSEPLDGNFTIDGNSLSRAQAYLIDRTISTYFTPEEIWRLAKKGTERESIREFLRFEKLSPGVKGSVADIPTATDQSHLLAPKSALYKLLDPLGAWASYVWTIWHDKVTGRRVRNLVESSTSDGESSEKGTMRLMTPKEHREAGHRMKKHVTGVHLYDFSDDFFARMARVRELDHIRKAMEGLVTSAVTGAEREAQLALPTSVALNVSNNFGGQIYLLGHRALLEQMPEPVRAVIAAHEYLHLRYPNWPESEVRAWVDYQPATDWMSWWTLLNNYLTDTLDSAQAEQLKAWVEQLVVPAAELSVPESNMRFAIETRFQTLEVPNPPKVVVIDTPYWVARDTQGEDSWVPSIVLDDAAGRTLYVQRSFLAELSRSARAGETLSSGRQVWESYVQMEAHDLRPAVELDPKEQTELATVGVRLSGQMVDNLRQSVRLISVTDPHPLSRAWARITGGGDQLGGTIARQLAAFLGYHISSMGRRLAPLDSTGDKLANWGVRVKSTQGDVSNPADVHRFHESASDAVVDIQNAGVAGQVDVLPNLSLDDPAPGVNGWRSTLAINFDGVVYGLSEAFRNAQEGHVAITISSWYKDQYRFFRTSYIVSKRLVSGLTELLGPLAAERGITLADVAPTLMEGPRFNLVVPKMKALLGQYQATSEIIDPYLQAMVPERAPPQKEIAQVVLDIIRHPIHYAGRLINAGRWSVNNLKRQNDLHALIRNPIVEVRDEDPSTIESLSGKRVLITVTGFATDRTEQLAQELIANGAEVQIAGENFDGRIAGSVVSQNSDLSDPNAVHSLFENAGHLDAVIHVSGSPKPEWAFVADLAAALEGEKSDQAGVRAKLEGFESGYLTPAFLVAREAARTLKVGAGSFIAVDTPPGRGLADPRTPGYGEAYLLQQAMEQIVRTFSAEQEHLGALRKLRAYQVRPVDGASERAVTAAILSKISTNKEPGPRGTQHINRLGLVGAASITLVVGVVGYFVANVFFGWDASWMISAGASGALLLITSSILMAWPESTSLRFFFSGPHDLIAPLAAMRDVHDVSGGQSVEFVSVRWDENLVRHMVVNKARVRMFPPLVQWLLLSVSLVALHEWVHASAPQLVPGSPLRRFINEIPAYGSQVLPLFLGAGLGEWLGIGAVKVAMVLWALTSLMVLIRVKTATDKIHTMQVADAMNVQPVLTTNRAQGPKNQRVDITQAVPEFEGLVYQAGEIMTQPGVNIAPQALELRKLLQAGERERPKPAWERGLQRIYRLLRTYVLPVRTTAEVGAPAIVHVIKNLPARSRRFIDSQGHIHLVFNQVYIQTLLDLHDNPEMKEVAEYLMARRLNRDMAQRRRIPTRRQEFLLAVSGAERDLDQYAQLVQNPVLRQKLETFLQSDAGKAIQEMGEPYAGYMKVLQQWLDEKNKYKRSALIEAYVRATYRYDYVQHAPDRLAGQVVVVTGAGSGIGEAIAQEAVKEGANVVITGRDTGKLNRAIGVLTSFILTLGTNASAFSIQADVSHEGDTARVFQETATSLGRIDVLVNNAGQSGPVRIHAHKDMARFRDNIDVHFMGVWQNTVSALSQGVKKVITVSTYFTEEHPKEQRPYRNRSDYTFAQGMKNRLAHLMALANPDVKFIVSNPGPVHSDRIYGTVYPRNAEELVRLQNPVSEHLYIAAAGFLVRLMGDADFNRDELIQKASLILRAKIATGEIPRRLRSEKLASLPEGQEALSDQRALVKARRDLLTTDQIEVRLRTYFEEIYKTARKIQSDTEKMIVDKRFLAASEVAQEVIQLATPIGDQHNGQVVPIGGINYKPLLSSGIPMFRPSRPSLEGKLAVFTLGYSLRDTDIERLKSTLRPHLLSGAKVVVMAPSMSIAVANSLRLAMVSEYPELQYRMDVMSVELADESAVQDAFLKVTQRNGTKPEILVHATGDLDYTRNMENPRLPGMITRPEMDALMSNYAMATGIVLKTAMNAMAPEALEEDPRLFKNARGAITVIGPSLPTGAPHSSGDPELDRNASEKEMARVELFRGGLRPLVATINQEMRIVKSKIWVNLVLPGRPDRKFANAERTAATVLELSARAGDESSFSGLILTPDETDAEIRLPDFGRPTGPTSTVRPSDSPQQPAIGHSGKGLSPTLESRRAGGSVLKILWHQISAVNTWGIHLIDSLFTTPASAGQRRIHAAA